MDNHQEVARLVGDAFPLFITHIFSVIIRHHLHPGEFGAIVKLHGEIYAREHGFNSTFEAYVAAPLADFVRNRTDRDQIWIAERNGRLVGCIAIVRASETEAQLRWFLVHPAARGHGLGKRLLNESISFCRGIGYRSIFLWTVSALTAAGRLYTSAGFQLVEEHPAHQWGVDVIEQKYAMTI